MKKRYLSILLIVILALTAVLALVACVENHDCAKDGHKYGDDGKCVYCGEVKANEPNPSDNKDNPDTPDHDCAKDGHEYGDDNKCKYCGADKPDTPVEDTVDVHDREIDPEKVDYVSALKLDTTSNRARMSVTVKYYIDGDTTHFNVPSALASQFAQGILKARYLAVDTPESTGVIEEYGKRASNFTHNMLASVDKNDPDGIVLESNNETWNPDSTGERYLVWVWYRTSATEDYRLLNLELIQEGLARAKNVGNLVYTDVCVQANDQAIDRQYKIFSGKPDPLFFYGEAYDVTIKAMRLNQQFYAGKDVYFKGVVSKRYNQGCYVESYDAEDDMYYGVYIFFGYNFSSAGLRKLQPGNELSFTGSATYSEAYGFQVSNIQYDPYIKDPEEMKKYVQLISEDNEVAYSNITVEQFNSSKTILVENEEGEEEEKTVKFAELAMSSSVSLSNLTVTKVYTTKTEGSKSKGAMTLTCKDSSGNTIEVRTEVLYEEDKASNPMVTADKYLNKTIDVKGLVDYFKDANNPNAVGQYQIRVFSVYDIEVHEEAAE